MAETERMLLSKIRIDGGTQSRAKLNPEVVEEYAEILSSASKEEDGLAHPLPPLVGFHDGKDIWLADGFHRFAGHEKAGLEYVNIIIRQGTRHDAILYSVGANANHGLRRTQEDKRRAVRMILSDELWKGRSTRWIAQQCKVSSALVERVKTDIQSEAGSTVTVNSDSDKVRYRDKHGNITEMNTSNLRKPRQAADDGFTVSERPISDERREMLADDDITTSGGCRTVHGDPSGQPFDKFNADIRAGINTVNALIASLKEVLGYDPKTKALKNKWAKYFTAESTIQSLQQVAKNMSECCPAEMDGDDFISVKQAAIRSKTVAA